MAETGRWRNFDSDSGSDRCNSVIRPMPQKNRKAMTNPSHAYNRYTGWALGIRYKPSMKLPMNNGIAMTSKPITTIIVSTALKAPARRAWLISSRQRSQTKA